ncbi:hypothetical protein CAPTEDRAFT_228658 [Capitella teleta]|uniref:Guanine nucleotide exchange factor DBS-like n=2 Tax=Capitella teleta TaxID=283909 RepID=R7UJE2_CAPTE|nr:hypothetical protein CAPTEDRAFT_228658 [Capitella teleta]|eukprot:ELU03898.1 hypothetical protein CAPTEDRAFT_228658 [Capitella teleta]
MDSSNVNKPTGARSIPIVFTSTPSTLTSSSSPIIRPGRARDAGIFGSRSPRLLGGISRRGPPSAFGELHRDFFRNRPVRKPCLVAKMALLCDFNIEAVMLVDCCMSLYRNRIRDTYHAIEKFSANTSQVGESLRGLCDRLQQTEFPNDVPQTEKLIGEQSGAQRELHTDLGDTIRHGEILRGCFRTVRGPDGKELELTSAQLPPSKLAHVTAVERLLVQLDETKKNFDDFWAHHDSKLQQCLQLRQFEEEFRQLQCICEHHLQLLSAMTDLGDSYPIVESLISDMQNFEAKTKDDFAKAEELNASGEKFIEEDHYAVDCIRPKCIELQRICEQYKELLRRRNELLQRSRELHERIDLANRWCSEGVDLLAAPPVERCTTIGAAESALAQVETFLGEGMALRLGNPKEFRSQFDTVMSPDVTVRVQQVLQRIEDVRSMCDKRRHSLKTFIEKPSRPVQAVSPAPHQSVTVTSELDQKVVVSSEDEKAKKVTSDSDSPSTQIKDENTLLQKRRMKKKLKKHVMRELIETERIYVSELKEMLEGYAWLMEEPSMQHLMPAKLKGRKRELFGNMEEIYDFHANIFLKELENCRNTPALVGKCFAERSEEFKMYSYYCQNKPISEDLRREIGDNNPFFKECQARLDHKLPLGAYLLKPVQRITKYQLLLKEMLKYSQSHDDGVPELQEAVESMLCVLKYVNDIMHQIAITGYQGNLADLGHLLMQGSFSVWTEHKKDKIRDLRFKPMQRHIFLYENKVLFCKKKEDAQNAEKAGYIYKNSLETHQIGLTPSHKGDKRKFEIWLHNRTEMYIIQAPNMDVQRAWTKAVQELLLRQFDRIRENAKRHVPSKTLPGRGSHEGSPCPSLDGSSQAPSNASFSSVEEAIMPQSANASLAAAPSVDYDDDGWQSEDFDDDTVSVSQEPFLTESALQELQCQRYVALADYTSTDSSEISLQEGDVVDVLRVGSEGWWYVRPFPAGQEGWTPASYLEPNKRASTYSTHSTLSSGSTGKTPEEEDLEEEASFV